MKLAMVYQRKGTIFLHASSLTTAGVWILDFPVLAAESNIDPVLLGTDVLQTLSGSKENVPHPSREELGRLFDPVLRLANVRSWGTFSKSAQCVGIECEWGRISLLPKSNWGPKDGFRPLPEKRRSSTSSEAELGVALLSAFGDCE
jgi:hypothetical protein